MWHNSVLLYQFWHAESYPSPLSRYSLVPTSLLCQITVGNTATTYCLLTMHSNGNVKIWDKFCSKCQNAPPSEDQHTPQSFHPGTPGRHVSTGVMVSPQYNLSPVATSPETMMVTTTPVKTPPPVSREGILRGAAAVHGKISPTLAANKTKAKVNVQAPSPINRLSSAKKVQVLESQHQTSSPSLYSRFIPRRTVASSRPSPSAKSGEICEHSVSTGNASIFGYQCAGGSHSQTKVRRTWM
jgi:hypothetical protein